MNAYTMNQNKNFYLAIMAGGVGSRFWPASREVRPKQFIDMLGTGQSLLQMTHERFRSMVPDARVFCVTNEVYIDEVARQLPGLSAENIIGEPSRNNTAPSVLFTALAIAKQNPEAVIGFVPSDHLILKTEAYSEIVHKAVDYAASHDAIVTLGITPSRPDSGYGYIRFEAGETAPQVHKVVQFTEKPQQEDAVRMLASGDYLWNAGMFFMHVNTLLASYKALAPDLYDLFMPYLALRTRAEEAAFLKEVYPHSRNVSIDYAIIERADHVFTIPSDIGWSDLGTWKSLYHEVPKDESGNAIQAENVVLDNVYNTLIRNNTGKLVILRDVRDLIVVEEEDVLLIYPMDKEQEIKKLGELIKKDYRHLL